MHVQSITKDEYWQIVQDHKDRTVFHNVEWLELASQVYGSKIVFLGLFDGIAIQGACPIFCKRKFGWNLLGSPLPGHATPRLLPLFPDSRLNEALEAIGHWCNENRVSFLQISWKDTHPQLFGRMRIELLQNLEIPLGNTIKETWMRVKPKARNEIRYAASRYSIKIQDRKSVV